MRGGEWRSGVRFRHWGIRWTGGRLGQILMRPIDVVLRSLPRLFGSRFFPLFLVLLCFSRFFSCSAFLFSFLVVLSFSLLLSHSPRDVLFCDIALVVSGGLWGIALARVTRQGQYSLSMRTRG